jgi:copper/silver efflux system protein
MIEHIIEFSVRNKWLVILVWLGVAIWGLYAVLHTPVDAIPDLSENQVIVFADWMGRSPQDIEDQVTYPLSVQLQGLAGVKAVRASSEFNFSMINVIFDDKTDFYFARQRVLERLTTAQASMPQGVVPYMAPDATALGQIFWYTVEGRGKSLDELRAIQDFNVRYQLASVPGVAEVASVGGMVREYQVDVDPERLRAYDLSLGQVYSAVAGSNMSVGGKIVVENSSEYLVRGIGWLQGVSDLENVVVTSRAGVPLRLREVATVQLGPEYRRSALEKNGREVAGGVVMMRFGQNPLSVTQAIKLKIRELQAGLPQGVRIVPFYDRTHLIESAIHTVTGTLREEMIIASVAILLILTHFRSALVVCVTLPMAVLISFLFMFYLNIPSNIMSLCGIAISIGILVDAAVVMVENASHELKAHFAAQGSAKVHGDTTEIVVKACRLVGRPIFFSVVIMLLSFLPVFSFGGQEGKLSRPLAFTKSFAMIGVATLAITFVPALIPLLIKGRIRGEEDNWIVRSFINIYKPTLAWVIDRPAVVWWLMAIILAIGAALFNAWWMSMAALVLGLLFTILGTRRDGWTMWILVGLVILAWLSAVNRHDLLLTVPANFAPYTRYLLLGITAAVILLAMIFRHWRTAAVASVLVVTFLAQTHLPKLGSEFMPSLNEGSILDMPTSAPRIAMGQAVDDVMVRDRVLNSFPEVAMVVGKVGRADTATDPSPLDMVETVVTLNPPVWWPKRKVEFSDLLAQGGRLAAALQREGLFQNGALRPDDWPNVVRAVRDADYLRQNPRFTQASEVLNTAASVASEKFDAAMRELAHRRQREFEPDLARELDRTALELFLTHVRSLPVVENQNSKTENALLHDPTPDEISQILTTLQPHGLLLVESERQEEVDRLLADLRDDLIARGIVQKRDDLLLDHDTALTGVATFVRRAMGSDPPDFAQRVRDALERKHGELVLARLKTLDWELFDRAPALLNDFLLDRLVAAAKGTPLEGKAADAPSLQRLRDAATPALAKSLFLWPKTKDELLQEMDSELQMPGWGNAWTQPIINRVNMLATGVRTQIGVKVFGPVGKPLVRFERDAKNGELVDQGAIADVQRVSEEIAARLKTINGAVDVIPDQAVGKRYLEITIDREKAARYGVNMTDLSQAVETALGGGRITTTVEGRQRFPVRLRYTRENWQSLDDVRNVLVSAQMTPAQLLELPGSSRSPMPSPPGGTPAPRPAGGMGGGMGNPAENPAAMGAAAVVSSANMDLLMPALGASAVQIPLSMVADIRIVQGPSMIKSENGRLRNYVTLNVRGRDLLGFVEEAKQALKPIEAELAGTGMSIAWSGEYEAQVRANVTLAVIFPMVIILIILLLYITFHDFLDTMLAFLAVLGALSGALMFQAFFGFNRSVVVSIGYISAFGMATETAVIMLVYLRQAIDHHGGLAGIQSLEELRQCVIQGAVHRLRPKLLTEGVAIVGLVPMLWATGTGAEVMRPMAAPVLGGLLISDEVIDLMIPVLFYWIRRARWMKIHQRQTPASDLPNPKLMK